MQTNYPLFGGSYETVFLFNTKKEAVTSLTYPLVGNSPGHSSPPWPSLLRFIL